MKKTIICLLLGMALTVNVCALEAPTDITVQNLNGSQQIIKTYTLPPDTDLQVLIEEPFEQEGFRYTFADIVKEENRVSDRKLHSETVTVETDTKDMAKILEQLEATLDYDDGVYSGVLTLDHTALRTEPAGYASKASTVTAVKTIGPLDRNDMSYVPATTVKDGVTLSLSNVEWQVIGTDLAGDALVPTSYQAVAAYSGKSYYKVATGYVTSADYVGEITRSDVESVTYRLTYLGTESGGAEGHPDLDPAGTNQAGAFLSSGKVSAILCLLGGLGLTAIAVLAVLLVRSRREIRQLQEVESEEEESDHEEETT